MTIIAGWTLETLKERIEGEIEALSINTDTRFSSEASFRSEAQEAIKVGFANAQKALDAAAVLAKEAVGEAKTAHAQEHAALAMALSLAMLELKEKLVEMNNMRNQITAERGDYVSRDKLDGAVKSMEGAMAAGLLVQTSRADIEEAKIGDLQAWRANMEGRMYAYAGAITVGLVILNVVMKFVVP